MRVVASSGSMRDFKEAEIDRHLEAMARVIERAQDEGGMHLAFTLIVRSPSSAPAKALVSMKEELVRAAVSAKAILAKLEPEEDLRRLFASLSELTPQEEAGGLIRWARNPRLLDAHEQATYGDGVCWSGDAMRRDADKRNALALFDDAAPDRARLGRLAFEALWAASSPISQRRLLGPEAVKPSGAYEPPQETAPAPLQPSLQGWPLIRH